MAFFENLFKGDLSGTTSDSIINYQEFFEFVGDRAYGVVNCGKQPFVDQQAGIKVFPIQWVEE